ncbi:MAG TPA: GNAT family protein [Mycobacteriales bacterium]|nr:GNAT family protein [Mycobacteriales bacterium]
MTLEPLDLSHVEGLAAAAAQDRAAYGFTWVPTGPADTRGYVEAALIGQATGTSVPFAVRRCSDGALVGSTRFLDLAVFASTGAWVPGLPGPEPSDQSPPTVAEIGSTWYSADAQRTGVNTDCKLLMLTHAFEVWCCKRVTLKTDARNARSRAAIERLGACFDGVLRAHSPASDGGLRDTAYYSILDAEWGSVRARLAARAQLR